MFTSNAKREFVPRDQVSRFTCRLLFIISTHKLVVYYAIFLSTRIVVSWFYLLIFYFEKFSTWIWRLPFAVYVKLNLSIGGSGKEAGPHYDVRINQSMYLKMKFSRHFNFFCRE